MIKKIISGAQTGADQGGLLAGMLLGIATGGTAPKGWLTEDGPQEEMLRGYGLIEHTKMVGFAARTGINVGTSDGTVIFGRLDSSGSKCALKFIQIYKKPNIHFDFPWNVHNRRGLFLEWIERNGIETLNVSGNRESVNPGIQVAVCQFLVEVLSGD